jgi:hypothetical protein
MGLHVIAADPIGQAFSFAPDRAILLALLGVMPALLVFYVRCSLGAKKLRPDFWLGKLERIELERAVLLYAKVSRRRDEIRLERDQAGIGWRSRHLRAAFRNKYGGELEELQTYARDLRRTIVQLRNRPVRRSRLWIRAVSSRYALGGALVWYSSILATVIACYCLFDPPWLAPGKSMSFDTFVLWQTPEGRLLLANWVAVSLVGAATPLLYFMRRRALYRWHGSHIDDLRKFAAVDPEQLVESHNCQNKTTEEEPDEAPKTVPEMTDEESWWAVLGVTPSATIEEVKQAYRVLIKQSHPDRVHNMSPAFRDLAVSETRKLNVAYEEALDYLQRRRRSNSGTAAASRREDEMAFG